jgi:Flp pilus assembly protein TadD
VTVDPSEPYLGRATAQLSRGDAAGAVETLRRALGLAPDHAGAHALLALALLRLRRRHAARSEAATALALEPEGAFPHLAMGAALEAFGDLEGAEAELRRFQAERPDSAAGHRALARVLAALGRPSEAREALDRALSLDPDDPDTLAALSAAARDAGRLDEAERLAREALAADPEHEDALVALGEALLRRGRVEEARQLAVAALQIDATSLGAIRLLSSVKARESFLLGLWWRWSALMDRLGPRALGVLTLLFVAYRFAVLGLRDLGHPDAARGVQYVWLAFAVYTWVGPSAFRRSLQGELAKVRLRKDF